MKVALALVLLAAAAQSQFIRFTGFTISTPSVPPTTEAGTTVADTTTPSDDDDTTTESEGTLGPVQLLNINVIQWRSMMVSSFLK